MTSAVSSSDNGMASQMPSVPQSRGMKRKLGTRKTNLSGLVGSEMCIRDSRTAEPRHEEEARNEKDEPAQECETRSDPDPFEALVVSDRRQIDDKTNEAQGEPW